MEEEENNKNNYTVTLSINLEQPKSQQPNSSNPNNSSHSRDDTSPVVPKRRTPDSHKNKQAKIQQLNSTNCINSIHQSSDDNLSLVPHPPDSTKIPDAKLYPKLNQPEGLECDGCDAKMVSLVLWCESCNENSCVTCDTQRHQNAKRAAHKRIRKINGTLSEYMTEKLKAFRLLACGSSAMLIESAEFIVCAAQPLSVEKLNKAYQMYNSNENSLVRLLLAEIREACHLKKQFETVLWQTNDLGAIDYANINDFLICMLDCCKQRWQQNNIAESLVRFDYPMVLGHNSCSMNVTGSASHNFCNQYGLHLSELYHLMNCVNDEAAEEHGQMAIVVSIGTRGTLGKTKFLNEIWKTKFEERTEQRGVHHDGLLELHVGDDTNKRNQHLVDLHGDKYAPILVQKLGEAADLVIIHCLAMDIDLIDVAVHEELAALLSLICQKQSVLLIVHGLSAQSFPSMDDAERSILSIIKLYSSRANVLAINSKWQEKQNLLMLQKRVANVLAEVETRGTPLKRLYDALLLTTHKSFDAVVPSNEVPEEFENLRQQIHQVLKDNESIRQSWFPLNKNSIAQAALDDEQYETAKNRDAIKLKQEETRKQRTAAISEPVKLFRDSIANVDNNLNNAAVAISILQQELVRMFQPNVDEHRKRLKQLKEEFTKKSTNELRKQIKQTTDKLISFDIAAVHFIRELIERGCTDKIDSVARNAAIFVCQNELLMGRSIEIVNGDTLTIPTKFLQQVLHPILLAVNGMEDAKETENDLSAVVHHEKKGNILKRLMKYFESVARKPNFDNGIVALNNPIQKSKFVAITVVGVESSGKSTLWNELWNTNFPVAHGKCSRGLWTALVHVQDGPPLLVNDTEGIMSPICENPRFDQKLVLLAFAMSHIIIINIRGEGAKDLIDLLKLIIYAAHKLSVFHRPQIVFVHRDITGVKAYEQGSFKNIIIQQLHDACADMSRNETDEEMKLESIIDTNNIHSFDLPSAIAEPRIVIAGVEKDKEERTEEFVIRCRMLRSKLIEMSADILHDKSKQFPTSLDGKDGWIERAQTVWELAKQNASLWTYASVNDMIQRRYIEKELWLIVQKHTLNLNTEASIRIDQILDDSNANSSHELATFASFLEELRLKSMEDLGKEINEVIGAFPGPSISQSVTLEYKEKIKRDLDNKVEEKKNLLNQREQQRRVTKNIDAKVQQLQEKMDRLKDKNYSKEDIEIMFDSYLTEGMKEFQDAQKLNDISAEQLQAIEDYKALGRILPDQFQGEFINSSIGSSQFQHIANQMHIAYRKNVSTRFVQQVKNNFFGFPDERTNVLRVPEWAKITLNRFDRVSEHTVDSMNRVEEFVYQFLWVKNGKKAENVKNTSSRWTQLTKDLGHAIDNEFVAEFTKMKQTKSMIPFQQETPFQQAGYVLTLINLFHAFACNMLYYFIQFKNEIEVADEIAKFREDGLRKKAEFVLRAQSANSADDAATEIVRLIIDSVVKHSTEKAKEKLKNDLLKWNMASKLLVDEAMETTFHNGNFQGAYEFITAPLTYLQTLCRNHFLHEYNKLRPTVENEFLVESNKKSYLAKNLSKLAVAATAWKNQPTLENLSLTDGVRGLFQCFATNDLSFLKEIENSVITYFKNTDKHRTDINNQLFYTCVRHLLEEYSPVTKKTLELSKSDIDQTFTQVWPVCRGCEAQCPYCGQKCSGNEEAHLKHYCDHHLLQAYTGWHDKTSKIATLRICTEPVNFKRNYETFDKDDKGRKNYKGEYIPFAEHIERYYNDWNITPVTENEDIHESEKVAWLVLRDKFAESFAYKTDTPPEWEQLYRERANRMVRKEKK